DDPRHRRRGCLRGRGPEHSGSEASGALSRRDAGMTPSLYRDQFLDREWGPAELDAVAEFWLRLYESASKPHSFTPLPEHHTEIRIRGVPRADAGRVGSALAVRAAATDFWDPRITHPDEDTVSLSTGDCDGRDAPPAGLGLPI